MFVRLPASTLEKLSAYCSSQASLLIYKDKGCISVVLSTAAYQVTANSTYANDFDDDTTIVMPWSSKLCSILCANANEVVTFKLTKDILVVTGNVIFTLVNGYDKRRASDGEKPLRVIEVDTGWFKSALGKIQSTKSVYETMKILPPSIMFTSKYIVASFPNNALAMENHGADIGMVDFSIIQPLMRALSGATTKLTVCASYLFFIDRQDVEILFNKSELDAPTNKLVNSTAKSLFDGIVDALYSFPILDNSLATNLRLVYEFGITNISMNFGSINGKPSITLSGKAAIHGMSSDYYTVMSEIIESLEFNDASIVPLFTYLALPGEITIFVKERRLTLWKPGLVFAVSRAAYR